ARLAVYAVVFNIALFAEFLIFTYIAASLSLPLMDDQLAALDRSTGFDWLNLLAVTNANPILSQCAVIAYKSSGFQLIALSLLLAFMGRRDHLEETLSILAIAALLTAILNGMVPAAGAYVHYAPRPELFSHLGPNAGLWHYSLLLSMSDDPA